MHSADPLTSPSKGLIKSTDFCPHKYACGVLRYLGVKICLQLRAFHCWQENKCRQSSPESLKFHGRDGRLLLSWELPHDVNKGAGCRSKHSGASDLHLSLGESHWCELIRHHTSLPVNLARCVFVRVLYLSVRTLCWQRPTNTHKHSCLVWEAH